MAMGCESVAEMIRIDFKFSVGKLFMDLRSFFFYYKIRKKYITYNISTRIGLIVKTFTNPENECILTRKYEYKSHT